MIEKPPRESRPPAELYSEWDTVRTRRQNMEAEFGLALKHVNGRNIDGGRKLPTIEDLAKLERLEGEEQRLWRAYQERLNGRV